MKDKVFNKGYYPLLLLIITQFIVISSCQKILNEKSDNSLAVPSTVSDYQSLLDNINRMNNSSATWDEAAADNVYLPDELFNKMDKIAQEAYLWNTEIYNGPFNDWEKLYDVVYYSNLALEGINLIERTTKNENTWNNVKGSALFFRAESFLHTIFIFCKAYDSTSAKKDYGIALRLSSDYNHHSTRDNLEESYYRIILDLKAAIKLLPKTSITPFRPSKAAAYALLARTYLSMRKYSVAEIYADSCLQIKDDLLDFNTLDLNTLRPFKQLNKEVIFKKIAVSYSFAPVYPQGVRVDTLLYKSYKKNDLRLQAYFYPLKPGFIFKGTYNGNLSSLFTGIATDEVYLMRAECNARQGKIKAAMRDINKLIATRWTSGTYRPYTTTNAVEALLIILRERRKELPFRCIRFMDIKRRNKEGANISIKRIVNGEVYYLPPNDNRFALPLPTDIIELSGMPQNPR